MKMAVVLTQTSARSMKTGEADRSMNWDTC